MKHFIILVLGCVLGGLPMQGQDCSAFYPFSEGVKAEYTTYNKKGKIEGATTYEVVSVTSDADQEVATIHSDLIDKKGEVLTSMTYDIICQDDKVSIGFKSLLSPEIMEQYKDIDLDITGTDIDLPNNLSVGQNLPDADMKMTISAAGMNINMNVMMLDRKVVGQEQLETPAGSFDCYIITYTTKMKMGLSRSSSAKQWIAKGVGLVKQEEYNKKGKLTSSGMLTKYSS